MAGMGCDRWRSFTQPEHLCNDKARPWGMNGFLGEAAQGPEFGQIFREGREAYRDIRAQELQAEVARAAAKQAGKVELAKIEAESRTRQAEARAIEAATTAGKSPPIFTGGTMPAWALPAIAVGAGLLLLLSFTRGRKK